MTFEEKDARLVEEYGILPDAQERFSFLIEQSTEVPPLEKAERKPEYLVEGCMSQVWVLGEKRADGRLHFRSDSDAPMVKALAWVLSDYYSGGTAAEIAEAEPGFLRDLRLLDALTENRRRGARHIVARIKSLARML